MNGHTLVNPTKDVMFLVYQNLMMGCKEVVVQEDYDTVGIFV